MNRRELIRAVVGGGVAGRLVTVRALASPQDGQDWVAQERARWPEGTVLIACSIVVTAEEVQRQGDRLGALLKAKAINLQHSALAVMVDEVNARGWAAAPLDYRAVMEGPGFQMAATGNNELLQVYATTVLYVGTASADLTTSVVRRLAELTTIAEQTARLKAMTVSAGGA